MVQKALEVCDSRRLQSIAFPAIGIGNLKFPLAVAVETLVGCAVDYIVRNRSTTSIKKVILVGFEERAHALFLSTVEQRCGVSHAGTEPGQHRSEDVHPPPETVPDYPDLKLPKLQLEPPPRGTPPLGTPLEFSILAESDYHCSQAEAELQQKVNEVLQRDVVEHETIEQLPTSFLTAFQSSAKAAHVKVTICHNPARAELYGPKEDVTRAVDVLERALDAVANRLQVIHMQVISDLQQFQWKFTSGLEGMTTSYSPEECYALEKTRQLQRKTASFKRGGGEQVTVDMKRLVEVGAGAARTTQVYRVQKEGGVLCGVHNQPCICYPYCSTAHYSNTWYITWYVTWYVTWCVTWCVTWYVTWYITWYVTWLAFTFHLCNRLSQTRIVERKRHCGGGGKDL